MTDRITDFGSQVTQLIARRVRSLASILKSVFLIKSLRTASETLIRGALFSLAAGIGDRNRTPRALDALFEMGLPVRIVMVRTIGTARHG